MAAAEKNERSKYNDAAVKLFGGIVQSRLLGPFKPLGASMRKAGMHVSMIEYLSAALLTSAATLAGVSAAFSVILVVSLSVIMPGLAFSTRLLMSLIAGAAAGLLSAVLIFSMYYAYPSVYMNERKKRIEGALPFTILYLTTMAGGGTSPVVMFTTLAKFEGYGEMSKEAKKIVEEIDVLGLDVLTALKNAAQRTPSQQLADLLWGMATLLEAGGDLKAYLREQAKTAMNAYRLRLKQFSQQLAMLIEMYITVVIVGSVFFMVLTAIMGAMSGADLQGVIVGSQLGVVFIGLPVAVTGFLLIARGMSPKTD